MKVVSWRTAALGAAAVGYVVLKAIAIPLLDDDPATVPNFREVLEALIQNGEIILVSLGLGVARDNVVTSDQVKNAIERSRQR